MYRHSSAARKLAAIWPQSGPAEKRNAYARYKKLLTAERLSAANSQRGRALFQKTCAVCHKLYGEGAEIGPDLTGSDRSNLDYFLANILNPSGIVPESYRVSNVTLKDDRSLTGIVTPAPPKTITLHPSAVQFVNSRIDLHLAHFGSFFLPPKSHFDR